jgi:hypothetical protein
MLLCAGCFMPRSELYPIAAPTMLKGDGVPEQVQLSVCNDCLRVYMTLQREAMAKGLMMQPQPQPLSITPAHEP